MLLLYILLLAVLALFTAYTRNFQRTIVAIGSRLDSSAAAIAAPRSQGWRTAAMMVGWPSALGLGLVFIAWWKAVALVVGAFMVLVPVLGALTPRPLSRHYLECIGTDLAARIANDADDTEELRRALDVIDQLSREPSP
jgi:hypothetical protein